MAAAIEAIGDALLEQTTESGREFAAMLDVDTGAVLGDPSAGEAQRVTIMPHLRAMAPEHRYVQIHTHPGSLTFSDQDVALFLAEPQVQAMVVAGPDRLWHLLSRTLLEPPPDPVEVLRRYAEDLIALAPRYRALVGSRMIDRATANREGRHEAMRKIARRYRLRYDRVDGGTVER